MFEVDQFVADCRAAFAEDQTHKARRSGRYSHARYLLPPLSSRDWASRSALNSFSTALPNRSLMLSELKQGGGAGQEVNGVRQHRGHSLTRRQRAG